MHDYNNGVYYGKDKIIELTDLENRILNLLILNKGKVVRYREFAKYLFRKVETYKIRRDLAQLVHKLRLKLKDEVKIETRTDIGYIIY